MRASVVPIVLLLLSSAVASASPPPYTDADIVALDISGTLLAPAEMVSQVAQDLTAIRAAYPGWIAGVDYVQARSNWVPGMILVKLTPQAWADYLAGTYTGLDALNAQYGPVSIGIVSSPGHLLKLEFQAVYNSALLDDIYTPASGVEFAEPNFVYGDGSDIISSQVGSYTFKRGWGDCPAGCTYNHYWDFTVSNGIVTLVRQYGNPTLASVGDTPAPAALLVGNAPNPFNNHTDVTFRVATQTQVQLWIYDATGRLVKNLHDDTMSPGAYATTWDGTNDAGQRVASGVYFCRLSARGATQTRKLLMVR
jgi:hypothetical protein